MDPVNANNTVDLQRELGDVLALRRRIDELEVQLAAQRKTNAVLINRIARSQEIEGGAVSLTEQNTLLHQSVETRTRELEEINRKLRQEIVERKLVEQALRFSEERYRYLLEETEQPFVVIRNFDFIYANPAAARLLGFKEPQGLMTAGLSSVFFPEDVAAVRELHMKRMAGQAVESRYEVRFRHRRGDVIWCDVNAQVGEFDGALSVLVALNDITERKRAAAELARSLSILQATLESTADGVLVVDAVGKFITYNRKFVEMWQIPEAVISGGHDRDTVQHLLDLVVEPARFKAKIDALYADPEAQSFDLVELRDGRVFERFSQPQRINGRSAGRVWSFRDVTERRRAEQAIRASEERFRGLVQASPDYILMLDREGAVTFINRTADGTPPEQALGRCALSWVREEYHEAVRECFDYVFSGKQTAEFEFESVGERWYLARMTPVEQGDGELQAMVIVTDITERRRGEEQQAKLELQLRQAQKMEAIGTLAGGIAHDFNNILYAIQGYAELVLDTLPEGSVARADQREVIVASKRASDLVKQILAFSRQSKHEQTPTAVATIVREVLKLMRASLPTTIEINPVIETRHAVVLADPTQLHQVLMNLCTNAGQAMPDGGTLTIGLRNELLTPGQAAEAARPPGNFVVLRISDTGCGITAENLERIFDPFFTTKEIGEGTGLGLSTVHGIVTAMGGDISVTSEVGRGTTFEVWLPQAEGEVREVASEQRDILSGSERVLFIEDEAALSRMGRDALARLGYVVESHTDSTQAWERFAAYPRGYDLVITDQTMPGLTGTQLAEKMLALRPDLPIILCTGFSAAVSEELAAQMGIRAYLTKPVGMRDLALTIRKVLDVQPTPAVA
jgi:PAS domain S-box-containing protein